ATVWMQGSVVRSWLLELLERAYDQEGSDLKNLKGWVADSGEGRWTVIEGINHDVPMTVLAHSLFARFTSRQDDSYAMKVAAALRGSSDDAFRTELHDAVAQFSRTKPLNEEVWSSFAQHIHFVATPDDAGYDRLAETLSRVDAELGTNGNRLFYLATPPAAYAPIVRAIGTHRLRGGGWSRVVIEKPFGHDLVSATELTGIVHE